MITRKIGNLVAAVLYGISRYCVLNVSQHSVCNSYSGGVYGRVLNYCNLCNQYYNAIACLAAHYLRVVVTRTCGYCIRQRSAHFANDSIRMLISKWSRGWMKLLYLLEVVRGPSVWHDCVSFLSNNFNWSLDEVTRLIWNSFFVSYLYFALHVVGGNCLFYS